MRNRPKVSCIGVSVFLTLLAIISSSCKREEKDSLSDTSQMLFQKSEQLLRVYIDSIKNAKDSLALNNIIKNFDGKITNLNYDFPPDTDLGMSEEENDSLITLYKKLEKVKAKQDSIVMKRVAPKDTINVTEKDSTYLNSATPASHNQNN